MNKLVKIETFRVPPRWLFVRVETAAGLVGWGEGSLEGHTEAVEGAYAALRDRFIGADCEQIEDIWQTAYRLGFYRGGPVLMSALSGLDIALWDIKGKTLNAPIWRLLGGRVRERVPVYAWIGGDRPGDVVAAARVRRAQGFNAVKMNGTDAVGWLDSPKKLDATLERVASAQAEGVDVAVDFHGRIHKPMAKQLVAALEPLRPLFIEEPLLSEHLEGLQQLAALTHIPLAWGERLFTRWEFKAFLHSGAIDIVQPDLAHAGGLSECRRIAAMAEAYDVAVAPHCPLGPIAFAACLQLALMTPNFVIQEMPLGIHYNSADHDLLTLLKNPEVFAVADGMVNALEGAGLGIEIDEQQVRAIPQDKVTWRNPVWRGRDGSLREW